MPEITLFGWFHTGIAILALLTGFYTLARFKIIRADTVSGATYLVCTVLAAGSALAIYRHGSFGAGHGLAILTLLAISVGSIVKHSIIRATCYSATLLFHMIPAITDGLMRLPVAAPVVTNIEDPLLRGFYLAFLSIYLVGLSLQIRWLRRHDRS